MPALFSPRNWKIATGVWFAVACVAAVLVGTLWSPPSDGSATPEGASGGGIITVGSTSTLSARQAGYQAFSRGPNVVHGLPVGRVWWAATAQHPVHKRAMVLVAFVPDATDETETPTGTPVFHLYVRNDAADTWTKSEATHTAEGAVLRSMAPHTVAWDGSRLVYVHSDTELVAVDWDVAADTVAVFSRVSLATAPQRLVLLDDGAQLLVHDTDGGATLYACAAGEAVTARLESLWAEATYTAVECSGRWVTLVDTDGAITVVNTALLDAGTYPSFADAWPAAAVWAVAVSAEWALVRETDVAGTTLWRYRQGAWVATANKDPTTDFRWLTKGPLYPSVFRRYGGLTWTSFMQWRNLPQSKRVTDMVDEERWNAGLDSDAGRTQHLVVLYGASVANLPWVQVARAAVV